MENSEGIYTLSQKIPHFSDTYLSMESSYKSKQKSTFTQSDLLENSFNSKLSLRKKKINDTIDQYRFNKLQELLSNNTNEPNLNLNINIANNDLSKFNLTSTIPEDKILAIFTSNSNIDNVNESNFTELYQSVYSLKVMCQNQINFYSVFYLLVTNNIIKILVNKLINFISKEGSKNNTHFDDLITHEIISFFEILFFKLKQYCNSKSYNQIFNDKVIIKENFLLLLHKFLYINKNDICYSTIKLITVYFKFLKNNEVINIINTGIFCKILNISEDKNISDSNKLICLVFFHDLITYSKLKDINLISNCFKMFSNCLLNRTSIDILTISIETFFFISYQYDNIVDLFLNFGVITNIMTLIKKGFNNGQFINISIKSINSNKKCQSNIINLCITILSNLASEDKKKDKLFNAQLFDIFFDYIINWANENTYNIKNSNNNNTLLDIILGYMINYCDSKLFIDYLLKNINSEENNNKNKLLIYKLIFLINKGTPYSTHLILSFFYHLIELSFKELIHILINGGFIQKLIDIIKVGDQNENVVVSGCLFINIYHRLENDNQNKNFILTEAYNNALLEVVQNNLVNKVSESNHKLIICLENLEKILKENSQDVDMIL